MDFTIRKFDFPLSEMNFTVGDERFSFRKLKVFVTRPFDRFQSSGMHLDQIRVG